MTPSIRLSGILAQSTVNGKGLRKVFFSQGCSHHCFNCFSPHTWPFEGGQYFDIKTLVEQTITEGYLDGVTFSGGDPFQQAEAFANFAQQLKQYGMNIWVYTGYTLDELLKLATNDKNIDLLIHNIDVLVDGKYVDELKNVGLKYRGSNNQRIIDVPASLQTHNVVLFNVD